MKNYDLTIVGGGPVGIYAAFYGGLKGMKIKLVESLNELGGQLMMLYPEKFIYDTPSVQKIKAKDLIKDLIEQMNDYKENIDVLLNNTVRYVEKNEEGFKVSSDDEEWQTKTILVAAGKGAYLPRRLTDEGEEKFSNIGYAVKHMEKYRGKEVVIFGGGDSAVDWANMLTDIDAKVSLIHRREDFRAHTKNVVKFEESAGNIYRSHICMELQGEDKIKSVLIKDLANEEEKQIKCDEVLVFFGSQSSIGRVANWGMSMERNSVLTQGSQKTSIEGIYACGDICKYDGKINTITTGYGETIIAVNAIYKHIHGKVGQIFSSSIKK